MCYDEKLRQSVRDSLFQPFLYKLDASFSLPYQLIKLFLQSAKTGKESLFKGETDSRTHKVSKYTQSMKLCVLCEILRMRIRA